jgi:hypothetical protein
MPTTVEATVMITLSSMPSRISVPRETKSGLKNEAMKAQPRLRPSATRDQLTSIEAVASTR